MPQEEGGEKPSDAEYEKFVAEGKIIRRTQELMYEGRYVESLQESQKMGRYGHYGRVLLKLGFDLLERNDIESADAIIKEAAGGNDTLRKEYQRSFCESLAYRYSNLGNFKDALRMVMKIEDEKALDRALYLVVRNWIAGRAGALEGKEKEARFHEALDAVPFSVVMRIQDICNEYRREQIDEIADLDDMIQELDAKEGAGE